MKFDVNLLNRVDRINIKNIFFINNMKDEKYIQLACSYAEKSTMFSRHGCIIAHHGKIISYGVNQLRNYSNDGIIQGCSCHAEMDALRNANKTNVFEKRYNLTAYLVRFNRNQMYLDARPCILCYQLLKTNGIKTIVYTIDGKIERIKTKDFVPIEHTKGNVFVQSIKN